MTTMFWKYKINFLRQGFVMLRGDVYAVGEIQDWKWPRQRKANR